MKGHVEGASKRDRHSYRNSAPAMRPSPSTTASANYHGHARYLDGVDSFGNSLLIWSRPDATEYPPVWLSLTMIVGVMSRRASSQNLIDASPSARYFTPSTSLLNRAPSRPAAFAYAS